jgi:hypothetical protein
MKISAFILFVAISSNIIGQVFHNTAQVQRLILGQPNTLLLSAGISDIQRIEISRLGNGDGNSYFNIGMDETKLQLIITPLADIVVYDTIYHDWVEWEKNVRAGQMNCEFIGDTMFIVRENLDTGEYEWAWSVRDVAHPIKAINERQIDLVEMSESYPFRLVVTTNSATYEQTFECVRLDQRPLVIFCGKNGGELNRNEVTANSEVWVNFQLSEKDQYGFPYLKSRNPIRPNRFTITISFESCIKEYRVNGNKLHPELLEAIQDPNARKLWVEFVEYADNNSLGYSKVQGIGFTLK